MARSTSSGLRFLVHRKETGKYTYWRALDRSIAPHVIGEIRRSWAVSSHRLSGNPIAKVSLQTGDHATASNRWSEVHSQIEAMIRSATVRAKLDEAAKPQPEKMTTLTSEQRAVVAGQARHDVLADDDAVWSDPSFLSTTARGTQLALRTRRGELPGEPPDTAPAPSNTDKRSLNRIRAMAREMDARTNTEMIRDQSTWPLDRPAATLEELMQDPKGAPGAKKFMRVADVHGELDQRLAENGIELPKDSAERIPLALSVLRGKAVA